MNNIRSLRWIATMVIVLLANVATWASPVLKEYIEIDYDSAGIPVQVSRMWQLDDDQVTKVRVLRDGAAYVVVAERNKRLLKFWFSLRADEVYVVEVTAEQSQLALRTSSPALVPESEWKPLGEKQVAGIKCRGWSVPSQEAGATGEMWIDEEGSVVYSASLYEGRLLNQLLRVRSGDPSQSDSDLFTLPHRAREKSVSFQVVSSLLMRFFGKQQGTNPSSHTKR